MTNKALRTETQRLINLLTTVDKSLAASAALADLDAAQALIDLDRMVKKAEKLKGRVLAAGTNSAASDT